MWLLFSGWVFQHVAGFIDPATLTGLKCGSAPEVLYGASLLGAGPGQMIMSWLPPGLPTPQRDRAPADDGTPPPLLGGAFSARCMSKVKADPRASGAAFARQGREPGGNFLRILLATSSSSS
jgi:hypothetical protein